MTVPTTPALQPCVMRILNGPLQGCEFALGQGTTLFVVGAVELLGDGALSASVPADAIFVPLEQGGCNFEVLADQAAPDGLPLRLLGDSVEVRHCAFQARVQVGGLHIALRPDDQAWAPELLGHGSGASSEPANFVKWRVPLARWIAGGLALVALVVAIGLWSMPGPAPETDIRVLISGASAEVQVLRGRDHRVYVFVSSERDAGWSRQVLTRHNNLDGQVLMIDQERRRLEQVLVDHDPQLAWHFLDLKDPSVPRLLLSTRRNVLTPDKQAQLLDTLLAAAPYARDIVVQMQDDRLLADLAQGGLQRLSLAFSRVEHEDSVTFAIEGNLQDSELAAARQYVDSFNRQWGDRYVHFAVELKDDALKGKSFQTGPQGYVKTSPSSWHFLNHTE
ncbi:PrgH/EprH family type III secretion apparatus protein [Pseudomonas fluorescens]|uniref:PrgH/EprH family type III secretion apparatus protein n=1 Tax=Pseudomonas fluorescens TaxID=294 RepID=UPI000CA1F0E5|nr:PrgH/EprH family type III secretion apparatus protein [Pseudomonas fluorescens]AUM69101.1 PrgH/EprH family type III secretion apparatus protein [Pseudomonas fluorescens]